MASSSKKPKLDQPARTMRTRSTTVPSHDEHSSPYPLMHKAIYAKDLKAINKLLEEGETFCIGDGLNCFNLAAWGRQWISNTKPSWEVVKRMLEVEPRGISEESEDGDTLLMVFTDCPDKIKFLVSLGANINAVDKDGNSVLMRAYKNPGFKAQGFSELLKLGADPNVPPQSPYPNLFDFMLDGFKILKFTTARETAEQCFYHLAQPEFRRKIKKSQLSQQTIFFLIDKYCQGGIRRDFGEPPPAPLRLHLLSLTFSPETQLVKVVPSSHRSYWSYFSEDDSSKDWDHLRNIWKIPDTFLLDPLSYFYFNVRSSYSKDIDLKEVDKEITLILEKNGCVIPDSDKVLPPGLAFLYNMTQRNKYYYDDRDDFRQIGRAFAQLLLQSDRPRMLQEGDKILKMLVPFFNDKDPTPMVSLVLKLMPSLPHHPFTIINNFVDDLDHVMADDSFQREMLLPRLRRFVQHLIPVVKTRLGEKLNRNDLERLNNTLFSRIKMNLVKEMQHPEVQVRSLLDICRWRIREELYIHRKKGQELNSCIRELCDRRPVPQTLIKMLLFECTAKIFIDEQTSALNILTIITISDDGVVFKNVLEIICEISKLQIEFQSVRVNNMGPLHIMYLDGKMKKLLYDAIEVFS